MLSSHCTDCLHRGPILVHSSVYGLRVEMCVRSRPTAGHRLVGIHILYFARPLICATALGAAEWPRPQLTKTSRQSRCVCCRCSREAPGGCESPQRFGDQLPFVVPPVRLGPAAGRHVHDSTAVRQLWRCCEPPTG